ncbi:hypothetical protein [Mitsuokella sp. WILCCON 0060]|uniref:hypothetical protein n=1 Tax=Mitsuokella sp. WILCCON 0060 TaxID=3345341 RepID=UPI003F1DFAFF
MGIMDSFNKDNLASGWKTVTDVAGKVAKQGAAGGKFVGEKAVQGAAALKENVQEDLARRKETRQIQAACKEIIEKNQLQLAVSQKMLEEEVASFNEAVEQLAKTQLYVYMRFCQYMKEHHQQDLAKSSFDGAASPDDMHVWQGKGYAAGAVAAGTAAGAATLGLVTAFGTASTGTALATLSGPAYVHATLAALGGGSLATGGLGMAGGAAVLGAVVAAPMLAVASFAADRKIRSDYDEVKRWQLDVIRYSEEVQDACRNNNQRRQSLRILGQDMHAFGIFFQEMLNTGLGAAACDEGKAYMPLLNDAATTLIAYSQLPVGKGQARENNLQDFETKREQLHEVERRCKLEFYHYCGSLSAPKQLFLEKAREQDSFVLADRLQEAIAELRKVFLEGLQDVKQNVQTMHVEMNTRFDAVDAALLDVKGTLANMSGDIRRLQQETERYLAAEEDDPEGREKILQDFTDQLTSRLLDSSLLRSHDLCAREQEILEERFGDNWQRLKPESQRFLITARVLFSQMEAVSDQLDYSGVCILMLKALECELHQRFFCDYRDFMESKHPFSQQAAAWPSVLCYHDRQGRWHQLAEERFTLGSVPYFCNIRVPEHISDKANEHDRDCLLAYAKEKLFSRGLTEKQIWQDLTQIGRDAERVTKRYRNRAAHVDALQHKEARECMDFLLDVQQVMVWMMKEFAA